MKVSYLGTASVVLDYAASRLITDPTFDPAGSTYSMAPPWLPGTWFDSTKGYTSPPTPTGLFDAALISHDHHFDNLDVSGRALVMSDAAATVITNPAAAQRLGRLRDDVVGLAAGKSTTLMGSGIDVTGLPARHGPRFTPQVSQVTGFLLEVTGEPTVWITGDTVMTSTVRAAALQHKGRVDVLIVHCGAVRFPRAPLLGRARFTFTPTQVVELCGLLDPRVVIPVHRSGWTHFQPESELRAALDASPFGDRVRWLEPGESTEVEAT